MINVKYCPSCGREITLIYGDTEVTYYQCWHCRVGVVHQGTRAIFISLGCSKHQFVEDGVLQDAATFMETITGIARLYCSKCKQFIKVERKEIKK